MTELWTRALRDKLVKVGNTGIGSGALAVNAIANMNRGLHQATMNCASKIKGEGTPIYDPTNMQRGQRYPGDITRKDPWGPEYPP